MKTLFISLLTCITFYAGAQRVKVLDATSRSWSGGVAGHHGTNYSIEIEFADTNMVPDTAWINGSFYPITIQQNDTIRRKVDHRYNRVTYNIYEGESWVDPINPAEWAKQNQERNSKPRPHRNYNGTALITYWYKGVQYSVGVKSFHVLPAQNYP